MCGNKLDMDDYCDNCYEYIEDPIGEKCPECGNILDEDNYCDLCGKFFDESDFQSYDSEDFEDVDYNSMVNNGDEICLNCTYWSVSPYGSAHGMVCRKGEFSEGPDDSCGFFSRTHHFASYGDSGQYQFDETDREIRNKLYHWQNSRF